jgi:hypothetical protein
MSRRATTSYVELGDAGTMIESDGFVSPLPMLNLDERIEYTKSGGTVGSLSVEAALGVLENQNACPEGLLFIDTKRMTKGIEIMADNVRRAINSDGGYGFLATTSTTTMPYNVERGPERSSGWWIMSRLLMALSEIGVDNGSLRLATHGSGVRTTEGPVLIVDDWIGSGSQMLVANENVQHSCPDANVQTLTVATTSDPNNGFSNFATHTTSYLGFDGAVLTGSHCTMDSAGGLSKGAAIKAHRTGPLSTIRKPYGNRIKITEWFPYQVRPDGTFTRARF